MKKILFISAFPPNKMTAGQNYSRQLINILVENYKLDLIYFSFPDHKLDVKSSVAILEEVKINRFIKVLNILLIPFLYPFFTSRVNLSVVYFLLKNSKQYDLIYLDFSQVFIYSLFIKKEYIVMMSHDVICQKFNRKGTTKLVSKWLFLTEKLLLKKSNKVLTFSDKDKDIIERVYSIKSEVVDFFINDSILKNIYPKELIENKFCFFGAWNRPENLDGLKWFVLKVLPFVNEKIRYDIIGPGLKNDYIAELIKNEKINVFGFLPNPYSKIMESLALIAPVFQGAGVKVKVLEALATGTPVIGTSIAYEGIRFSGINTFFECNSAAEFIDCINNFPSKSREERVQLKGQFNQNYPKHTFLNIIKNTEI